MGDDGAGHLQGLREQVIQELSQLADHLPDDDALSTKDLVAIALSSNDPGLLERAVRRARSIDDPAEKSQTLVTLLGELNSRLGTDPKPAEESPEPQEPSYSTDAENEPQPEVQDNDEPEPAEPAQAEEPGLELPDVPPAGSPGPGQPVSAEHIPVQYD